MSFVSSSTARHRFLSLPFEEGYLQEKWQLGSEIVATVLRFILAYVPEDSNFTPLAVAMQTKITGPVQPDRSMLLLIFCALDSFAN